MLDTDIAGVQSSMLMLYQFGLQFCMVAHTNDITSMCGGACHFHQDLLLESQHNIVGVLL